MNPRQIEVHIEELVLHGFPASPGQHVCTGSRARSTSTLKNWFCMGFRARRDGRSQTQLRANCASSWRKMEFLPHGNRVRGNLTQVPSSRVHTPKSAQKSHARFMEVRDEV